MKNTITGLLTAVFLTAVATFSALADEQRSESLIAFDEAIRFYVETGCTQPPEGFDVFTQVNLIIEATADENDIVRTNHIKGECRWHSIGAKNSPRMKPPEEPIFITTPVGDDRPIRLIAFDDGVHVLLKTRCRRDQRPDGYGRFHFIKFHLQATVQANGQLQANSIFKGDEEDAGCNWHPIITGSLQQ